jgi:hypothetical protein
VSSGQPIAARQPLCGPDEPSGASRGRAKATFHAGGVPVRLSEPPRFPEPCRPATRSTGRLLPPAFCGRGNQCDRQTRLRDLVTTDDQTRDCVRRWRKLVQATNSDASPGRPSTDQPDQRNPATAVVVYVPLPGWLRHCRPEGPGPGGICRPLGSAGRTPQIRGSGGAAGTGRPGLYAFTSLQDRPEAIDAVTYSEADARLRPGA